MSKVEVIRMAIVSKAELGSALKVWTKYIPDTEPSSVETDEDGDTFATGKIGSFWLEMLKQPTSLTFTYTHDEKLRQYTPISFLQNTADVYQHIKNICKLILSEAEFTGLYLEVSEIELLSSSGLTMARLRERIPLVFFPEDTKDGNYQVSVTRTSRSVNNAKLVMHGAWRNGRRTFTDEDDDGPQKHVDAVGAVISARINISDDMRGDINTDSIIDELIDRVTSAQEDGLSAI